MDLVKQHQLMFAARGSRAVVYRNLLIRQSLNSIVKRQYCTCQVSLALDPDITPVWEGSERKPMMSGPSVDLTAWKNVTRFWWLVLLVFGLHPGLGESILGAEPPRALASDEIPTDTRLGPLRGEQDDFSFVPAKSHEKWKQRAEYIRKVMHVTLGLWPMPTRSSLNPVIHGVIDQGDYTI
jgi:hypothetical protein